MDFDNGEEIAFFSPSTFPPPSIKLKAKLASKYTGYFNRHTKPATLPEVEGSLAIVQEQTQSQINAIHFCLTQYRRAMDGLLARERTLQAELKQKTINVEDPNLDVEKAFLITWKRKTHKRCKLFRDQLLKYEQPAEEAQKNEEEKVESKGHCDTLSKSEEICDFCDEALKVPKQSCYDPLLFDNEGIELQKDAFASQPESLEEMPYIPPAFAHVFRT